MQKSKLLVFILQIKRFQFCVVDACCLYPLGGALLSHIHPRWFDFWTPSNWLAVLIYESSPWFSNVIKPSLLKTLYLSLQLHWFCPCVSSLCFPLITFGDHPVHFFTLHLPAIAFIIVHLFWVHMGVLAPQAIHTREPMHRCPPDGQGKHYLIPSFHSFR